MSGIQIGTSNTLTLARAHFDSASMDIEVLLEFHDRETKKVAGRPDPKLEVLKRAGVILVLTAWETFIEDTLHNQFIIRIGKRVDERWVIDDSKKHILEKLKKDIAWFHTPNTRNIHHLFKKYLEIDIVPHWNYNSTSHSEPSSKLDDLVKLRGRLVHRSKRFFQRKASVRKIDLVSGLKLIKRLVERTEIALGVEPKESPLII